MSMKQSGCRGCLIWMACLVAGVVLIVGGALYLGYRQLSTLRDQFTGSEPLKLPVVTFNPRDVQAIHKRVDQFLLDAREGKATAYLGLSEQDVNTLLSSSGYSNLVHVGITNSRVHGRISIPIESLTGLFNRVGITFLKGRYVNGEGTFSVSAPEGRLSVRLTDLTVNGRPFPEHYMNRIRHVNMAEGIGTNSSTRLSLQRIRQIGPQDDVLILEVAPYRD